MHFLYCALRFELMISVSTYVKARELPRSSTKLRSFVRFCETSGNFCVKTGNNLDLNENIRKIQKKEIYSISGDRLSVCPSGLISPLVVSSCFVDCLLKFRESAWAVANHSCGQPAIGTFQNMNFKTSQLTG